MHLCVKSFAMPEENMINRQSRGVNNNPPERLIFAYRCSAVRSPASECHEAGVDYRKPAENSRNAAVRRGTREKSEEA